MTQGLQFKLPDVGEGLTEADIIKWHVAVGDPVHDGQTIVEIETAKSVVELPCPYDGVVAELLAAEGETVDVGSVIITVTPEGAEAPAPAASPEPDAEPAEGGEAEEKPTVLVGYGVRPDSTKRRPRRRGGDGAAAPQRMAGGAAPDVLVLAKPPVRKLAKDLGVDLGGVSPTGPNGTISRADVEAAATAPAEPVRTAPLGGGPREERIPVKGVRKFTATAMVNSAFTAPHVTEFLQVDVTETMEAVRRMRALPDFADVKVSPLLLVAKAVLVAMRRYPMANAAWDDAAQEIVVKHYVNLGVAVATDRGLVVPNVKDAHALSLPDLARALAELTRKTRDGKAQPADQQGGTVTITNVGVFGVDAGTPILNPGESAILAFGQVRELPWVVDGQVVPRQVTTLALSFDHRVVDGELGSYVLRDIGAMLHDPMTMLAWG
ncbi:MAG TPA: dihydrolipoamide acetyltransferase family protein [Streptosporangiaceae bacterium]|jgi:pyruvate dehydrogenase E2 component (dihydrolipoamide acetyltransferase)